MGEWGRWGNKFGLRARDILQYRTANAKTLRVMPEKNQLEKTDAGELRARLAAARADLERVGRFL